MAEERFADAMRLERERLNKEREQVFNQQRDLAKKLDEINREFAAIDAYEAAKSGKQRMAMRQPGAGRRPQARRGSKREAILQLVRDHPGGLSRGAILERLSLKGNRSGEMSVSNALTALTKSNQIARREGKYHPA